MIAVTFCLGVSGCRKPTVATSVGANQPMKLVVPEKGKYTGAYIDFGDQEDEVTLEAIENFEAMVGKHQAIIASSSYWGEQTFPDTQSGNHLAARLRFRSFSGRPGTSPTCRNAARTGSACARSSRGTWDAYIDKWGDAAREFGKPMIVAFGNEMNGDWFPWSGWFYGGKQPVPGQPNEWEGPETFKKAYRHVVDRVRARGAANIKWMFHTNNYAEPNEKWNYPAAYYPGSQYVDWLGLSIYGQQVAGKADDKWSDVEPLITWPYTQMAAVDPTKPIMAAEWGVGEFPDAGDKATFIREGLDLLRTKYPRIKAAIYWHERWQNPDQTYSNLRVNSSVEALAAYRAGIANPAWLDHPILRPVGPVR